MCCTQTGQTLSQAPQVVQAQISSSRITLPASVTLVLSEECSQVNEQNVVTVEGDGSTVVFKQIAGLIARRIVCRKKAGDAVAAGERVGLIKFGSRVDVLLGPEWEIVVQPGMRVAAGSSILARRRDGAQTHGA